MTSRRELLAASAAVAAACAPPTASDDSGSPAVGEPVDPDAVGVPDPITANDDFYTVSIGSWRPDDAFLSSWALTLGDADGNEIVVTLAELRALGGAEQERTLSCIGGATGSVTSNAMWTAITLSDLMAAVAFTPATDLRAIRITAGDGYVTDLPREDLDRGLALAWGMNGEDLPVAHGAPLRALVPGRYGMKNPKWITRIDFVPEIEPGFWESRGWSQDAEYQVASWFRSPVAGSVVDAARGAWIAGIAFAGERGVTRVEVSADDGVTWQEAEIVYPGGPGVWTTWKFRFTPAATGTVRLRVRAADGEGRLQQQLEDYDADLDGLEAWDYLPLTVG
jgi:DMSO/TMAO reductase YedYZ molybdopterin-dependent catalytic subunit